MTYFGHRAIKVTFYFSFFVYDKVRFYFLCEARMFKIKSRNALWFNV